MQSYQLGNKAYDPFVSSLRSIQLHLIRLKAPLIDRFSLAVESVPLFFSWPVHVVWQV